jgi:hypothetical protein
LRTGKDSKKKIPANIIIVAGLIILVVGLASPFAGLALPSPNQLTGVTTYYTIAKPSLGDTTVEMWSADNTQPNTNSLYTPVDCGSGSWSEVQMGLSGRVFGTYAKAEEFVLDSEDSGFWYAHRSWSYDAPDPTVNPNPTATSSPYPTSHIIGGDEDDFIYIRENPSEFAVNYVSILGALIAVLGVALKFIKK